MSLPPVGEYVVDTSVLVAYFVVSDEHHRKTVQYWEGLEKGNHLFHLPLLAMVETVARVYLKTQRPSLASATYSRLVQLAGRGSIALYPLDQQRVQSAIQVALRYRLRGADAIFAALADERGCDLITCDRHFASFPRAIVLVPET